MDDFSSPNITNDFNLPPSPNNNNNNNNNNNKQQQQQQQQVPVQASEQIESISR